MATKTLEQIQKERAARLAELKKGTGFVIPTVPQTTVLGRPNVDKTTTASVIKKIDSASAKTLLDVALRDSQYAGKLTPAMIQEFINAFNKESVAQAKTISGIIQTRLKPGATAEDIAAATANAISTEFPNYFNAKSFANNFVWSKINFKDKTAGGNALKALQSAQDVANSYGSTSIATATVQAYALKIAKGDMSLDDFKAIMQKEGIKNYPQFADAFARTPGATMYDLAQPYINQMAQTLELDPNSIKLSNPYLDRALRPDGTAGKLAAQSLADFNRSLMNSPEWEKTTTANNNSRDAAVGLARAMGMGL